MHEGADLFAAEEGGEVAGLVHVEDDDGHVPVGAEGRGHPLYLHKSDFFCIDSESKSCLTLPSHFLKKSVIS